MHIKNIYDYKEFVLIEPITKKMNHDNTFI